MNAGLEDVLREKERELKLHQRFLNLKAFCEGKIFTQSTLSLQQHITDLKQLIEKLIPEPKERSEEMFSGEIFSLLGAVYLHDSGQMSSFEWDVNGGILNTVEGGCRDIFMNFAIGRQLGIPSSAIEIINYLLYSHSAKRLPVEWAIKDGSARAIVRSPAVIAHIFNFAHLLIDLFQSDLNSLPLKRYAYPQIVLDKNRANISIDSTQGTIEIEYDAHLPYELHSVEMAKRHLSEMFRRFQEHVNGRMGFQYRKLDWRVNSSVVPEGNLSEEQSTAGKGFSGEGFAETCATANAILDKSFEHTYALVTGNEGDAARQLLESVVVPQLAGLHLTALYCELSTHPVQELREAICAHLDDSDRMNPDVISLCKKLIDTTPCVFIIDSMEKLAGLQLIEREKLERFLSFCLKQSNVFLILSGDKRSFSNWCTVLGSINTDAIQQLPDNLDKPPI